MTIVNKPLATSGADEHTVKAIKKECLRLLTRREHSRKEIEQKLVAKGFQRKQFTAVLDELTKRSWQNDSRYAESYLNMRSRKGFGPVKIAYELRQQGVDKSTVDGLIQSRTEDWAEQLRDLYAKKFASSAINDNVERGKRIRFLSQRGFPSGMIMDVINQFHPFPT